MKAIEESKKEEDFLPIIPPLGYEQLFSTLIDYTKENSNNPQIKKVMNHIYERYYMVDDNLGKIKDLNGEVIKPTEESIQIEISKEEIDDVKKMFSSIKMNTMDFSILCDTKTWEY